MREQSLDVSWFSSSKKLIHSAFRHPSKVPILQEHQCDSSSTLDNEKFIGVGLGTDGSTMDIGVMQAPRSQGCNQRSGAAFLIFTLFFTRLTRIAGFCRRMQLHGDDGCSLRRALLDCHSLVSAGGLQSHQHRGLCSPCTSLVKDCPRQPETTICHGVASNYHILMINPPSISYPLASGHADTATPR